MTTQHFGGEVLRYDPIAITAHYRQRPLQIWRRWLEIGLPLGSFLLRRWWDSKTGQSQRRQRYHATHLRQILTRLGPAFIKIGQALSTRPDVLPLAYLEEFAKLQDQLPPFSNQLAYQFIQEELGAPPDVVYARLTPDPIAAASLGQVYRGQLKTGEEVAVKVQRPGLAEQITLDVYLLRSLVAWAQRRFRILHRNDLVAILDEFATRLFEEMDYIQEGHNAERFAELYGHLPGVYVPRIYWNYTDHRVLTMEWITGTKLTDTQALQQQGINPRILIETGVQCSLRQLLEYGFFHADPHPGNLLAMPNNKLAYLDFGMMSEVKPYQRYGLLNAVVHILNREFDALVQDYIVLEFLSPDVLRKPIAATLEQIFDYAPGSSVTQLNFQKIITQLSDMMYEFPFRVPAYYALILRSLVTLEGIAMGIAPDYKVLAAATPYVARRLLTDPAPELQTTLAELLLKDGKFRWHRLANLLRDAGGNKLDNDNGNPNANVNANGSGNKNKNSSSFDAIVPYMLDFLLSERGSFILNALVEEITTILDNLGGRILQNPLVVFHLQQEFDAEQMTGIDPQTLHHMKRIWGVLQSSSSFDAARLLDLLVQISTKPEAQRLGQRALVDLVQRAIDRFSRTFLPSYPPRPPETRKALPPANITVG
jgi:predicted unusual protein kinase regulating ubiquinone biosynthesis (AarF/ABC1/UbiB family)